MSNLELTRESLQEIVDPFGSFGPLTMTRLRNGVAHDTRLLADAFDAFAPNYQLSLPGQASELASAMLRRRADS
jgi:hypothetical protein